MSSWKPKGACEGGGTVSLQCGMEEMEQCQRCGSAVRWDLVDHPFWGFKARGGCEKRAESSGDST